MLLLLVALGLEALLLLLLLLLLGRRRRRSSGLAPLPRLLLEEQNDITHRGLIKGKRQVDVIIEDNHNIRPEDERVTE